MEGFAEWTFEGSSENRSSIAMEVGIDGYHDRYFVAYMVVYDLRGHLPI